MAFEKYFPEVHTACEQVKTGTGYRNASIYIQYLSMDDYRATGIPEKTRMKTEFPIIRSEKSNSMIRWGRSGG